MKGTQIRPCGAHFSLIPSGCYPGPKNLFRLNGRPEEQRVGLLATQHSKGCKSTLDSPSEIKSRIWSWQLFVLLLKTLVFP